MRKPVVESIKEILDIYDEYVKKNKYTDGIGQEFNRLGKHRGYSYILFHYGNKMRQLGIWEMVYNEKWPLEKIIAYLKTTDDDF